MLKLAPDVTSDVQARDVAAQARDYFGVIDDFVNNAGYIILNAIEASILQEVEKVLDIVTTQRLLKLDVSRRDVASWMTQAI